MGEEVLAFERSFAEFLGCNHVVGVANGTDALTLALRALGIGRGDEVITASHTALATVAAILATGATPVLADIDPTYRTIDPGSVAKSITRKTRAVIAVHLYGQAADLDALNAIAVKHGLHLIEDCAQATGGTYRGRRLGSIGVLGTFSFYPTKNLGAVGDGGAVATDNVRLAQRVRRLRQYGWDDQRKTHYPGINSRLDPLQAAILSEKLPRLDVDNARRRRLAGLYTKGLSGLALELPKMRPESQHVFHLYVIECRDRDDLMRHLARDGIGSGIHYPVAAHRHRGYNDLVRVASAGLPRTARLTKRILSLPMYPELEFTQVDRVIGSIRRYCAL